MFVKICANTNLEDVQLAISYGADAVGFVFAPSKRRVTAEQVAEITEHLPVGVETVGVFTSDDVAGIQDAVVSAGLSAVQLHGSFDAAMVRALAAGSDAALSIVQTVAYAVDAKDRVAEDERFEQTLKAVFDEPVVWAVLIDAAKSGASGGLGVTVDWAHVIKIVQRAIGTRQPRPRVILAGGLNAENVAEAIAIVEPWGVDVASGVEAKPGKKEPAKVQAFVQAARMAARQLQRKI